MNRRDALRHIGKNIVAGTLLLMGSKGKFEIPLKLLYEPSDFQSGSDYLRPLTLAEHKEYHSIENILQQGSAERRFVLDKMQDGPTLMRHSTNMRPELIREHAKDRQNYRITEGDIAEINRTLERIHDNNLEGLLRGVSLKYAIDPEFYLAKISTESVGKTDAVSSAGALGIAQIMPETYNDLKRITNGTISKISEYIPRDTLNDLLNRPLRDLLLLTPEIATNMGIPLENDAMHVKSGIKDHLNVWLPYGIIAMREYGEFPGTGLEIEEALKNPRIGLEAGALTALNFWLLAYSATKDANKEYHNHDPGLGLVVPAYPLIPQASSSAYIAGQYGVRGTVSRMIESADEPFSVLEGMDLFENMNTNAGNVYSAELLRKYEYLKSNQS